MTCTCNIAVVMRSSLLIVALGVTLLLFGHPALAQEGWTKIDCKSARLLPPAGVQANCFQGPFDKAQGTYDCKLANDTVGSLPDGTEPVFYVRVRYPSIGAKLCRTIGFRNPTEAMQHVHKFVENQATNWTALQSSRPDLQVMFFDAKIQKRNGRCFTFTKNGPPAARGGGYEFTMIGFFCRAPGQPLDATTAAGMVDAVQLKF